LCGEFVPDISSRPIRPDDTGDVEKMNKWSVSLSKWQSEIDDWEMNRFEKFSGWKAVNVRKGRLAEDKIVITYLSHYTQSIFSECGYYHHPANPTEWGASPDGIIHDPTVTKEDLFKNAPTLKKDFDVSKFDICHGVAEFKATSWECEFKPYFIAQCMWEMQSVNVLWCDIVRYSSGKWKRNPQTGKSTLSGQKSRVFRLYRRKKADALLQSCVKRAMACRAKGDKMAYLKLMQTKNFIKIREYCAKETAKGEKNAIDLPIDVPMFMSYKKFREQCCCNDALIDEHLPPIHPAIERIEKRQYTMFNLYGTQQSREKEEFIRMATDQIEDYGELIKSFFL
jgi:hypothetical protein